MQGFVRFRIPIGLRRIITMVPAILIILLGVSEQKALVASQVILSFGIPFALIPLVRFTADKKLMGNLANRPFLSAIGVAVCTLIIILNVYVLFYSIFE